MASNKLDCRLSRTNFYKTILHRFIELGLIAERLEYNYKNRRAIKMYGVIIQPIPKRRPMGSSLPLIAHLISEKWNNEFIRQASSEH